MGSSDDDVTDVSATSSDNDVATTNSDEDATTASDGDATKASTGDATKAFDGVAFKASDCDATNAADGKATSNIGNEIKYTVELPPPSDSPLYLEGDDVLALHNRKVYLARVMRVDFQGTEWRYFVHYLGWNKNWDEWVGMDQVMKVTEENVKLQLAINEEEDRYLQAVRASQLKSKVSVEARGRKRKKDFSKKGTLPKQKLVKIHIPSALKKQLVDDCDFITHQGKLVKLPRTPNVDAILNKYLDYRLKKDGMIADSVGEVVNGLRCYFDKALSLTLLYEKERQQYLHVDAAHLTPSSAIYGAEHLLRLFVKLPEILYHANIEEKTLTEMQQILVDFLKFLKENHSSFFLSTYVPRQEVMTSLGEEDTD